MPKLQLEPHPFEAMQDWRSSEAKRAGEELEEWGFTTVVDLPFQDDDYSESMQYTLEVFDRWNEILQRCARTHHGMRGPTASGSEIHEGEQDPDIKEFFSYQMQGGLPDFLSISPEAMMRVTKVVHESNVNVACIAAIQFGKDPDELRKELSMFSRFSAGRLNRYQARKGGSKLHLDTSAIAGLDLMDPFEIKKGDKLYRIVAEADEPVYGHNFGKSLSLWLRGNRDSAVWHGVPISDKEKISRVWFTNFRPDALWPSDANPPELNNPVLKGGGIEEWCIREIGLWGVDNDLPAGSQIA